MVGSAGICAEPVLIFVCGYSAVLFVGHADAYLVVPFAALLEAAAYPCIAFLIAVRSLTIAAASAFFLVITCARDANVRSQSCLRRPVRQRIHLHVLCVCSNGSRTDQSGSARPWLATSKLGVGGALHLCRFLVDWQWLGIKS